MDLPNILAASQNGILKYLDMRSLFRLAMTSHQIWNLIEHFPGKRWPGLLEYWPGTHADLWAFKFTGDGELDPILLGESAHGVLLRNAYVHRITLKQPGCPELNMKTRTILLQYNAEDLLTLLDQFRPLKQRYRYLAIRQLVPNPEIVELLNSSTENVSFQATQSLPAYAGLKAETINIAVEDELDHQVLPYMKQVIGEWMRNERQILWITINGDEDFGVKNEDFHEYGADFPGPEKAVIQRADGKFLHLKVPQPGSTPSIWLKVLNRR
ncbi:unnamed protein product, partial [Mesorhabditis spiculigera]